MSHLAKKPQGAGTQSLLWFGTPEKGVILSGGVVRQANDAAVEGPPVLLVQPRSLGEFSQSVLWAIW
jgi:hypothetical protein